jgi:hypothetical protein
MGKTAILSKGEKLISLFPVLGFMQLEISTELKANPMSNIAPIHFNLANLIMIV